jgi:hypothetical protein
MTRLRALATLFFLLLHAPLGAQVTTGELDNDPKFGSIGFARSHWASDLNRTLVYLVPWTNVGLTFGDGSSVRALSASAAAGSQWKCGGVNCNIYPDTTLGIHPRDNPASFYIPAIHELWVWNGAYLDTYTGGAYWAGRLSTTACAASLAVNCASWTTRSPLSTTATTAYQAFTAVLDMSANGGDIPWEGLDPAMAWAETINTGAMIGGSADSGVNTYIVEPKVGGPETYKVTKLTIPRPPSRNQCMNCMVSDGTDFYLAFGYFGSNQLTDNRQDLWRLSKRTGSWVWTQLANPPDTVYTPQMTYDSDRYSLVAWIKNKLYEYRIASNIWTDITPAGFICRSNMTASYDRVAHKHVFMGGNTNGLTTFDADCLSGGGTQTLVFYLDLTALPRPPVTPGALKISGLRIDGLTLKYCPRAMICALSAQR